MATITAGAVAPNLLQLVQTPPADNSGLADADGWRFAVQIATAQTSDALWDVATWDSTVWSGGWVWTDIDPSRIRNVEWSTGTQAIASNGGFPRPEITTATIVLDNHDFIYSPWNKDAPNYALFEYGTLVRIAKFQNGSTTTLVTDADGQTNSTRTWNNWQPLYTGIVNDFDSGLDNLTQDCVTTISLLQTATVLAGLNKPAQSPVGSGENIKVRLPRLLNDAGWQLGCSFGTVDLSFMTLQPTTMAGNRLTEIYLASDSSNVETYTDVDGSLFVTNISATGLNVWRLTNNTAAVPGETSTFTGTAVYLKDAAVTNNADSVCNDVTLTNVGSTASYRSSATGANLASQILFGVKSQNRTDLIIDNSSGMLTIGGNATSQFNGIGVNVGWPTRTLKVSALSIFNAGATQRQARLFDFAIVDIYKTPTTTIPMRLYTHISGLSHTVTPQGTNSLWWTTSYSLVTLNVSTGAV